MNDQEVNIIYKKFKENAVKNNKYFKNIFREEYIYPINYILATSDLKKYPFTLFIFKPVCIFIFFIKIAVQLVWEMYFTIVVILCLFPRQQYITCIIIYFIVLLSSMQINPCTDIPLV